MSKEKIVLVVDDEEDLRDTVGYIFKSKGFRVETACDGLDALEKLETITPDLIVLDMNMPRMNGLEFYEKIKGDNEKSKYPVLVLTARANMEQLFEDLDVDGFMTKPFELNVLLEEGQRIIKKNSGSVKTKEGVFDRRALKVCIVEDEPEIFRKLALSFLETGFIVNSAQSGASAIKRIMMEVPDVVVIKVGLRDISGDIVILKLKRMIDQTKNVKFVLYNAHSGNNVEVTRRISEKQGVDKYIDFVDSDEIVEVTESLFA